ncbi:NAD(P)H-binding protein [Kribbella qitaiheensis]|uniref:NAD(P)H-binding protein n=1 Tax=Kribbella qitaiheensis TaxID=1544730 RepID=A0A7G6WYR3_9ACTN|nr:NAD(P)H-binding protein [Kribbella qitaiheensis]QNE19128.1 NAD(P)H-binding protein [Kribbella qitaiheensis]
MPTVLVTGATGRVGRHLVNDLLDAGTTVRALVRDPAAAALPEAVEVVHGDITDEAAVDRAAAGTDAAFLLWPSFSAEGAQPVVAALTEQVSRVVYLSSLSVRDDEPPAASGVWGEVEDLLIGSDWTFLRPSGFAVNTLGWAEEFRRGNVVRVSSPEAGRSLIHQRDIAAVAAVALLDDKHIGQKYLLTGPEVLTQTQQVAILSEAVGKPMRIEEQSPAEARQAMLDLGADPTLADSSVAYWASLVTNPEPVTTTVPDLLNRPALTFQAWAEEHADDFRN